VHHARRYLEQTRCQRAAIARLDSNCGFFNFHDHQSIFLRCDVQIRAYKREVVFEFRSKEMIVTRANSLNCR
jgi:hypothetical protein